MDTLGIWILWNVSFTALRTNCWMLRANDWWNPWPFEWFYKYYRVMKFNCWNCLEALYLFWLSWDVIWACQNQVLMIDEALVIYFILDQKWIYWNLGLMIDETLVTCYLQCDFAMSTNLSHNVVSKWNRICEKSFRSYEFEQFEPSWSKIFYASIKW